MSKLLFTEKTPPMFEDGRVYCPICGVRFDESEYLRSVISDEKGLFLANMVTHYRHSHRSSWNKCWGRGGGRYRSKWFQGYDDEKRKVNEAAKRQIIRLAPTFLKFNEITGETFLFLEHNDAETLALAYSVLGGVITEAAKAIMSNPGPALETFSEDSAMPFGQYKDKRLGDVPVEYLVWIYDNDRAGRLKPYIEENLEGFRAILQKK